VEEIFNENEDANYFLDEMPFDDFNPDLKRNNCISLVDLTQRVRKEKCLWAACRIQSNPIQKVSGIKLIFFGYLVIGDK